MTTSPDFDDNLNEEKAGRLAWGPFRCSGEPHVGPSLFFEERRFTGTILLHIPFLRT
jgi:hypothetical protein